MKYHLYPRLVAIILIISMVQIDAFAQFKAPYTSRTTDTAEFNGFIDLPAALEQFQNGERKANVVSTTPLASQILRAESGVPIYIDLSGLKMNLSQDAPEAEVMSMLKSQAGILQVLDPASEFELVKTIIDPEGTRHFRYRQVYGGIPVHNGEIIVHADRESLNSINGRWFPSEEIDLDGPFITQEDAQKVIKRETNYRALTGMQLELVGGTQMEMEMRIKRSFGEESLVVYYAEVHPSVGEHLYMLIDAADGTILESVSAICDMAHGLASTTLESKYVDKATLEDRVSDITFMEGDVEVDADDLKGDTKTIHTFQSGSDFFMVDISRPMYNQGQSNLPNEPSGAVWTIDGNGGSPQSQDFQISQVQSSNNKWAPLEVSAHWNGAIAYEYFRETYNRNSINGSGGTIISVINIKDENGQDLDNAFWNGSAMFYGNGNTGFSSPLAKSLDVAGHEMSHGIIQNTANLEYAGQSGAMNESFADIFGVMIDRDDWLLGEDVVNTSAFPSGALRNMEDPHNGGNQFGDRGWQPSHMNEFVDLPNTPDGDNGGVHYNSGITNRAFYVFATSVGKDVAELVFYRALSNYLVRSSQFVDLRIAVIKAATDLHGAQSAVVQSARDAFDSVGIKGDTGGDYEEDIELNPGDDFVLVADNNLNDLFIIDIDENTATQLNVPPPFSKPSMSDDGSVAVYVDQNGFLKAILFDWSQGVLDYEVVDIESTPQPIWRSIAVSKDGSKISLLTDNLNAFIQVFDFESQALQTFELFNPSTGSGGEVTGGVEYADAMEWDYSGERIVFDAFNVLPGTFGEDIEYWDIGFLRVWDNASDVFASGQIQPLFSGLPENVSVGNPSLAKNSPYVLVFDFLGTDNSSGTPVLNWAILTSNTQSGRVEVLFVNDVVGYPNYSGKDDIVIFDTKDPDDESQLVIGAIDTKSDDIMLPVSGSARVFIDGARFGTWFQTGVRDLSSSVFNAADAEQIRLWPNPVFDLLTLELNDQPDADARIQIYNAVGQLVSSQGAVPGQKVYQIDVSQLPQGVYSAQVSFKGKLHVGKFVVLR